MNSIYFYILCIVIALILVITKIFLERQENEDKTMGIAVNHEEYTMFGVLKLIKNSRKNN